MRRIYKNPFTIAVLIFLLVGAYFFFQHHQNLPALTTNKKNSEVVEKRNLEKIQNHETIALKNRSSSEELKISRALKHLQLKSRKPAVTGYSQPEKLIDLPLLAGSRWKIWPGLRALPPSHRVSNERFIEKMGHFNLVTADEVVSGFQEFDKESLIVVYDQRLKKKGVVTGLIKVETNSRDLLENSLMSYDAVITNSFAQINTYFVSGRENIFNLELLFQYLKTRSYVKSVTLDILDRDYEKR